MKLRQILNETYEIVAIDHDGYLPSGSSKKGTLSGVTYDQLVELFGEPERDHGEEAIQAYWEVEIQYRDPNGFTDYEHEDVEDYDIAPVSIYDWHMDIPVEQVTQWNVGAKSNEHFWVLQQVVDQKTSKK